MKLKMLAVPATIAATTAFAGAANATTAIDVNVDYWSSSNVDITIGSNPTAQYRFYEDGLTGKSFIAGYGSATLAAPGTSTYDATAKTNGSSGTGDGDYGLKFAINGLDYQGLATVDNNGTHISRIQASAAAVPEPATWATMILGLGVAGAAVRRRRQSAAATA